MSNLNDFPRGEARDLARELGPRYINFHFDYYTVKGIIERRHGVIDFKTVCEIFAQQPKLTYKEMMTLYPFLHRMIPENLLKKYKNTVLGYRDEVRDTPNDEVHDFHDVPTSNISQTYPSESSSFSTNKPSYHGYTETVDSNPSSSRSFSDYSYGEGLKRHHKTNRWIAHVKAYSKKHNVPYHLAIKQAKATYR